MSESLASAETIGGIAVEIRGDTAQLRAAAAEAKTITAEIGRLGPTVKIGADTSKIVSDIASLQGRIQPLRIGLTLDTAAAVKQIADLKQLASSVRLALPGLGQSTAGGIGTPAQNWQWGGVVGPPSNPQNLIGAGGGDGNTGGSQLVPSGGGGSLVLRDTPQYRRNQAAGEEFEGSAKDVTGQWFNGMGTGGAGGPEYGPENRPNMGRRVAKNANQLFNGLLGNDAESMFRIGSAFLVSREVGRLASVGSAVADYAHFNGGDVRKTEESRLALRSEIKDIPGGSIGDPLGNIADRVSNSESIGVRSVGWATGLGVLGTLRDGVAKLAGTQTGAEQEQFDRDQAVRDRQINSMAARGQDRERVRLASRDEGLRLTNANAEFGLSDGDRKVAEDKSALTVFDRDNEKYKGIQEIADQRKQMVIGMQHDQQVASAGSMYADGQSWASAANSQISGDAFGLVMGGDVRGADRMRLQGRQESAVNDLQGKLDYQMGTGQTDEGKRTETELQALKMANLKELAAYDKQSAQDVASSKMQAVSAEKAARLRLAHDSNAADLEEFDSNLQAKIDAEKDAAEKVNIARRGAAERSVMVAEQNEQVQQISASLKTAGRVALLASGGQENEAQIQQLESERDAALKNPKLDPRNRADTEQSYKDRLAALKESQVRQQQMFDTGIAGRIDSANARGRNESGTADIIAQVAGMKSQLVGAQTKDRGKLASADSAELRSQLAEMNRPHGYATAWSPYEAKGGPGGNAGKDDADTKQAIQQALIYLATIAQKSGYSTASN